MAIIETVGINMIKYIITKGILQLPIYLPFSDVIWIQTAENNSISFLSRAGQLHINNKTFSEISFILWEHPCKTKLAIRGHISTVTYFEIKCSNLYTPSIIYRYITDACHISVTDEPRANSNKWYRVTSLIAKYKAKLAGSLKSVVFGFDFSLHEQVKVQPFGAPCLNSKYVFSCTKYIGFLDPVLISGSWAKFDDWKAEHRPRASHRSRR